MNCVTLDGQLREQGQSSWHSKTGRLSLRNSADNLCPSYARPDLKQETILNESVALQTLALIKSNINNIN